jgi:glycosidase
VRNALLLHERGIDPYAVWLARSRELGISPWVSMRMNDVHGLGDETGQYINSTFWKRRPDLRRGGYCAEASIDRAFDYGKQDVRDYHFGLIQELVARYDMDGLELDWMRFPWHFRPGYELEDGVLLTEWLREVSRFVRGHSGTSGRKTRLAVRVPSRTDTTYWKQARNRKIHTRSSGWRS